MTRLEFTFRGHNRVANNMRARAARSKNTGPVVRSWSQMVRGKLKGKKYPSRLSHFKHIRTGDLANKWAVEPAGKNAYKIVNRANRKGFPYPVVVVGNAAGQRRGRGTHPSFARWWIAKEEIDKHVPELKKDLVKHIINV